MNHRIQGSSGPQNPQRIGQQQRSTQHKDRGEQAARSSYSFQDSRHVYREGVAETSFAFPEDPPESYALLGLLQGDVLELKSLYALQSQHLTGELKIEHLQQDSMVFVLRLHITQSWRSEAEAAFQSLCAQQIQLPPSGELELQLCLFENPQGGYAYEVHEKAPHFPQGQRLWLRDHLDLRLDEVLSAGQQGERLTLMVHSRSYLSLYLEQRAPWQGQMQLSRLPGLGDFMLQRLEQGQTRPETQT